jgi:uncharacterized protein (DUF885 family)
VLRASPAAVRAVSAVSRVAPNMIRSAGRVTRVLRRSPATRPLLRVMPTVIQRAATQLGRRAAQGLPVTPQAATQAVASQARQIISSAPQMVRIYRRSRAQDQRFHRARRLQLRGVTLRYG